MKPFSSRFDNCPTPTYLIPRRFPEQDRVDIEESTRPAKRIKTMLKSSRAQRGQLPSRPYNRKDDNPISQAQPRGNGNKQIARAGLATRERGKSSRAKASTKLVFESPRLQVDDKTLFPSPEGGKDLARRWHVISDQARDHGQDGTTYTIKRGLSITALKNGMMRSIASRVRTLTLWLDTGEDNLPAWLDTIAGLFENLENLVFLQQVSSNDRDAISVSARMRRLYVLYRLPYLRSIDNIKVTPRERQLARPSTLNGQRMEKEEWVSGIPPTVSDTDEVMEQLYQDDQPGLVITESIGNHTAHELKADLADLTQRLATIMDTDSCEHTTGNSRSSDNLIPCVSSSSEESAKSTTSSQQLQEPNKAMDTPDGLQKPNSTSSMEMKSKSRQNWSTTCGALSIGHCAPQLEFNLCGTGHVNNQIMSEGSFSVDSASFRKGQEFMRHISNMDTVREEGGILSQKRHLPPAGPKSLTRRKVVASSLLQEPAGDKACQHRPEQHRKSFQRTARSTSVMDFEEDAHIEQRTGEFDGHVPGEW